MTTASRALRGLAAIDIVPGMGLWPVCVALAAGLLPFGARAEARGDGKLAAAMSVRITSVQSAAVSERYVFGQKTAAAPLKFVYLGSRSARVANLHIYFGSNEAPYTTYSSGAWVHLTAGPAPGGEAVRSEIRIAYDIQDAAAENGKDFTLPICMPDVALDAAGESGADEAEVSVEDATGGGIESIVLPRLARSGSGIWRASFPAVPSWVIVRRANATRGAAHPDQGRPYPTGKFNRNFWGLVITLITWTIVYLAWATRGKRPPA